MENGKHLTLKLQLYPNGTAKRLMDRSMEVSGYVYNAFVYVGRYYRLHYNTFPSKNDLRGMCTKFWKNCPWMHDVANNCFFECADNAIRALKTCWNNYLKNKGAGLPSYKKKSDFNGFGHISSTRFTLLEDRSAGKLKRMLHISKIGKIKARNNQDEPPGLPKTCHIKRKTVGCHREYYATISYEVDKSYSKDEFNLEYYKRFPIGIDVGIVNIATLSDGKYYPNQKYMTNVQNILKKLHRQLSKRQPYTKDYDKIKGKLNHLYQKITNKRRTYCNNIVKNIVYENDQLYAESISVMELRQIAYSHNMRQQYNDACIGYFLKRIEVLSDEVCRPIRYVDYAYTSQKCSKCGYIVHKKLEERIHFCPNCKISLDRDHNAAINILNNGLACNPANANYSSNCTRLERTSEKHVVNDLKPFQNNMEHHLQIAETNNQFNITKNNT